MIKCLHSIPAPSRHCTRRGQIRAINSVAGILSSRRLCLMWPVPRLNITCFNFCHPSNFRVCAFLLVDLEFNYKDRPRCCWFFRKHTGCSHDRAPLCCTRVAKGFPWISSSESKWVIYYYDSHSSARNRSEFKLFIC